MGYVVTANVTGEPATVQQEEGRTVFSSRGEAEEFQRALRGGGFDRVDVLDVGAATDEQYYSGQVTAPASTPNRYGGKPQSYVQTASGQYVNVTGLSSQQTAQLQNLERAIDEKPQLAGMRKSLQQQITQPEAFKTSRPSSIEQQRAQEQAERASKEITASGIIREYEKLPEAYKSPETLRRIAEASRQKQLAYAPLIVLGRPRQLSSEEVRDYVAAGRSIEAIKEQGPRLTQIGLLEVQAPQSLKKDSVFSSGNELAPTIRPTDNIFDVSSDIQDRQVDLQVSQKKGIRERFREKITFKEQEFRSVAETFATLSKSEQKQLRFSGALITAGFFGTRALRVSSGIVLHPVQTITAFFKPETYKQLYRGFKEEPQLTLFDLFVGKKTFDVGIKGVQSAIPKVRTLEIPQAKGEPSITRLVGFETKGGRAVVLGAKTPEGIKLGTPDVLPALKNMPVGKDVKVGSALETKTLQKALGQLPTAKEQIIIPTTQTILRKTARTQPVVRSLSKETERLPPEGVKIALDVAKQEGGVVFGGFSRAAQLSEKVTRQGQQFEVLPRLRDIDIRFEKAGVEELRAITKQTITRFQKAGIKSREVEGIPFAIEVKQPSGVFEKAVEFKGRESFIEGESVPEFVLGIRKEGKPIKTNGQLITGLPEELRGVAQGVIRVTKKKGNIVVFPPPKRIKDIGSFVVSARTLEQSRLLPSRKLTKSIETFESLFSEKLVTEQLKLIREGKGKVQLIDFSKKTAKLDSSLIRLAGNQVSISASISPRKSPISPSPSPSFSPSFSPSPSPRKSPISPSPSPSFSPSISPSPSPQRPTPGFFGIFSLPKEFSEEKQLRNIFNPFSTKYKPSVVGLALNIRGKKPKVLTGLEIRPILFTERKRRGKHGKR